MKQIHVSFNSRKKIALVWFFPATNRRPRALQFYCVPSFDLCTTDSSNNKISILLKTLTREKNNTFPSLIFLELHTLFFTKSCIFATFGSHRGHQWYYWFEVCRLHLSSATSDLTIPIESVMIKSTIRIHCKHLVLSTSIALPRKRPFYSHMSDVVKLRCYQSKPIADHVIGSVFCDSVRRRSFGYGMRVPRPVATVATRNRT